VQVVSYTQAQRAKQELDRLHSNGEPAFLIMRNGYTVVFVGPFPSKDDALGKISGLRNRYRDCFVKSL
jgi:cell division septation protein DedD